MTELLYRAPRPDELAECALVWHAATDDYLRRLNRPLPPPVLDRLVMLLEHLLSTDPEGFVIAVRPAQAKRATIAGFGIAAQRETVRFLSQLYVLPDFQGIGIGTAILRRVMPGVGAASGVDAPVLATVTDSAQPASNGLYARLGLLPRMPMFNLVGRPSSGGQALLPSGVHAVAFSGVAPGSGKARSTRSASFDRVAEAIDSVDRAVLGYRHRADHRDFLAGGRVGFVYENASGEVLAYGYSSASGRFGPVAVLDESLMPAVLAHLLDAVEPRGATSVWVPGENGEAMRTLLEAGLVVEGFPALLCWNRPFASFERYLPAGPALL